MSPVLVRVQLCSPCLLTHTMLAAVPRITCSRCATCWTLYERLWPRIRWAQVCSDSSCRCCHSPLSALITRVRVREGPAATMHAAASSICAAQTLHAGLINSASAAPEGLRLRPRLPLVEHARLPQLLSVTDSTRVASHTVQIRAISTLAVDTRLSQNQGGQIWATRPLRVIAIQPRSFRDLFGFELHPQHCKHRL